MNKGRLIIISGPTASGKSTLWRRLVLHSQATFSVSATTRDQRNGEENGRDYFFIGVDEFKDKINKEEFLEWAKVHGNYYGTLREQVAKIVDGGQDVILEIDVQGYSQIAQSQFKCVSLFINPPSREILIKRLVDRGTEDANQIAKRLEIVDQEVKFSDQYDYCFVNDNFETMLGEVEKILGYTSDYHG